MADTAELFDEDHDKRWQFLIGFAGLFLGVPAVRARVLEAFLARATELEAEGEAAAESTRIPIWLLWSVGARERFNWRSLEWRAACALIARNLPTDPPN